MGLARELTMGTRRKTRTRVGFTGDFAILRKLTAEADPDIEVFRAAIGRVAASGTRFRFAEGAAYNAACTRFRELTGEKIGPETGTY